MNAVACPGCGCVIDAPAHAVVAALARHDLDAALDLGLLSTSGCPSCSGPCTAAVIAARDERRAALAARERFRARQARLARREADTAARRPAAANAQSTEQPALPSAAALALERALARARSARP